MNSNKGMGKLYGVGLGPGNPELVTIKAARLLKTGPIVAIPVTREDKESFALSIAGPYLPDNPRILRLHFPMSSDLQERQKHRREAAQQVEKYIRDGEEVAFLTEGDPSFYSTFIHILDHLSKDIPVEIIPGVSSINAAAADAVLPLVDSSQKLAVIPATLTNLGNLRALLTQFDTVILIKVDRMLDQLLDILDETGHIERGVLVERASLGNGRVVRDLRSLRGKPVNYFSLVILPGIRVGV